MSKNELNNLIVRYATANEEKKAINAEVKDLGEEIKEEFEEMEITSFEAMGWTATMGYRKNRKPNLEKIAALLGGKIPDDCFDESITPTLTVKANKAADTKAA